MRTFDLFVSDKCGKPQNTVYKEKRTINNTSELKAAVATDHVAAAYQNNKRMNENFIQSDCVMFDVDNTDTDTSGEWITTDTLRADFPDVEFYVVMTNTKNINKKARPTGYYHNTLKPRPLAKVNVPFSTAMY